MKFTECTWSLELGGNFLNLFRTKTQFFERLQSVSVVDGAARTQKDDVESNGGSLENVAKVFVLFLCGVRLVLRSGVLTILDLDKVDVTGAVIVEWLFAPKVPLPQVLALALISLRVRVLAFEPEVCTLSPCNNCKRHVPNEVHALF